MKRYSVSCKTVLLFFVILLLGLSSGAQEKTTYRTPPDDIARFARRPPDFRYDVGTGRKPRRIYSNHGQRSRIVDSQPPLPLPSLCRGYRARESVMHVAWETYEWLEKYVKNRKEETNKK